MSALITVFGTDRAGRHSTAAAREALGLGAIRGQGEGPQGATYAIPVLDTLQRPLSLAEILIGVRRFVVYARNHRDSEFVVPALGCALDEGAYAPAQIAPLFAGSPRGRCRWPTTFTPHLPTSGAIERIILAGSRALAHDPQRVVSLLDQTVRTPSQALEILHGNTGGLDTIIDRWARAKGLLVTTFPALWSCLEGPYVQVATDARGKPYNRLAVLDRHSHITAYGTRLIVLWDGNSRNTYHLIQRARSVALPVLVLPVRATTGPHITEPRTVSFCAP